MSDNIVTAERRAEIEAEIEAFMERYHQGFTAGTRDDLQALVHLPVIYVTETGAQVRDGYPFDPVKMRESDLGFHHADTTTRVVHLEETRAHLVIEGLRYRADGSVIESIESFYILHKRDNEWKVSVFSGIRGARA
ncbi:MAG: hypothetical protein R2761_10440 [Acidimicrobiales bacterium]